MGKGTISDNLSKGQYDVNFDYGSAAIASRIARLQSQIAQIDADIAAQNVKLSESAAVESALESDLNAAIVAYRTATPETVAELRKTVDDATIALLEQKTDTEEFRVRIDIFTMQKASMENRLDYLTNVQTTETKTIWCADYTYDATGDVETIEIKGEQPQTLIAPGAPAYTLAAGAMTTRDALSPEASFLNVAILPGWQKYTPTYRVGAITSIDRLNDLCDVDLDDATSSAQGLDINQTSTLEDVPIVYMNCNSKAFRVFDRVVVKFESQNWDTPKVVGFESNPNPCALGTFRYLGWPDTVNFPYVLVLHLPSETAETLINNLRKQIQQTPVVPYSNRVICEFRVQGENDWIVCPLTNTHFYSKANNEFQQSDSFQGVGDYTPVRWGYDVSYAGIVDPVFEISDADPSVIDLSGNTTEPSDSSVEDYYYFKYRRRMVWKASYDQADAGGVVVEINVPNLRTVGEWPDFSGQTEFEFRIRTGPNIPPADGPDELHLHIAFNTSTYEIYNFDNVNILSTPIQSVYWPNASYTPTELPSYTFPLDGTVYFYSSDDTLVDAQIPFGGA